MQANTMTRRRLLRTASAGVAVMALGGCGESSGASVGVRAIVTPDGGQLPSAAFDRGGALHVVFLRDGDVLYARSSDAGASFGSAVRVNGSAGTAQGGLFRGPEMTLDDDGAAHVVWYGKGSGTIAQTAMYSRQATGGGFEPARDVSGEFVDGLSLAVHRRQVALAWHTGEVLKVLRSGDGGRSFAPPAALPALPCECCDTSLQFAPDAALLLTYRDRREDRRDMYLVTLRPGVPPSILGLDEHSWVVKACPMSSNGLSADAAGALVAWEHDGDVLVVRVAAGGAARGAPVKVGTGKHPLVLSRADGVLVAWNDGSRLAWRLLDPQTLRVRAKGSSPRASPHRAAGVVTPAGEFLLIA